MGEVEGQEDDVPEEILPEEEGALARSGTIRKGYGNSTRWGGNEQAGGISWSQAVQTGSSRVAFLRPEGLRIAAPRRQPCKAERGQKIKKIKK